MKSGQHSLIRTIDELRQRCTVDTIRHCWLWQGGTATDGTPRIYGFDHRKGEKRTMTGTQAVWNIAHGRAPLEGWIVGRCCGVLLCLNPAHLREFRDKAEMGLHIRRAGYRVGSALEQRRANQRIACLAAGHKPTPPEVVLAIRAAPVNVTSKSLAALHGIAHQTASRIRRGESHRQVVA